MAEGVVDWYSPEGGYGYLTVLDCGVRECRVGDRVLVRAQEIQKLGYKTLDECAHVSFAVEWDRAGTAVARHVVQLDDKLPVHLYAVHLKVRAARPPAPAATRPGAPPPDRAAAADADRADRLEHPEHHIYQNGRAVLLERGFRRDLAPGTDDPLAWERWTARSAVRHLLTLCGDLVRPLSFEVTRQWVDEEFGWLGPGSPADRPPRWNWFARTPQAPPHVSSGYADPQVVEVATLDERSMLAIVDRVLDDPCTAPEGERLGWTELLVYHTWALLPEPDRHVVDGELRIADYDSGPLDLLVALERSGGGTWVSSPRRGVWDPFVLRVAKSFGTAYPDGAEYDEIIRMDIDVHWSFWWEPGPGRDLLDRALHRMYRMGWRDAYPEAGGG